MSNRVKRMPGVFGLLLLLGQVIFIETSMTVASGHPGDIRIKDDLHQPHSKFLSMSNASTLMLYGDDTDRIKPLPPMTHPLILEGFNWTLSSSHNISRPLERRTRSIITSDRDDFYDTPPTIPPDVCVTSPGELQSLNSALFDALFKMITPSTSGTDDCSSYTRTSQRPSSTTDCQLLINYIKTTANNIVCENALLKKMDVVSNGNYQALEAKYEGKILSLKQVIEKLKQNKRQGESQLRSDYEQRLQLLQAKINSLLTEIKDLKDTVHEKMVEIVSGRIESSKYSEAVEEYRKIKSSRDHSIPQILRRVYRSGDANGVGKIGMFLLYLPYMEEMIVGVNAMNNLMKENNDLSSPSVLVLSYTIDYIINRDNFSKVLESLRTLTQNLQNEVKSHANGVLSSMSNNIRDGGYDQVIAFASGDITFFFFAPHAETVMKSAYSGLGSMSQILPFLRTLPKTGPIILCAKALVKLMKGNGDIYSREGLELVYTLYQWSNVVSDSGLDGEIPSSLKLFGGKKCTFKNVDKGYEFLTATTVIKYSGERRMVVTHPNSWSEGNNAKWILSSDNWGKTFEIFNVEYKEYLYAASDYYRYDKHRRSVFTWVPGGSVTQGIWEVKPYADGDGGKFRIKNTAHGEKLYAAIDRFKYSKDWRRVFTWGMKGEEHDDEYWKIYCS